MNNTQLLHTMFELVVPLDTETTGTNPDTAEICELGVALFSNGKLLPKQKLFGTSEPIPFEASAVNHISRKMLEGLPVFDDELDSVSEFLEIKNKKYFVVHNHRYDEKVLSKYKTANESYLLNESGTEPRYLCTYRLARHFFEGSSINGNIGSFSLDYLRYYFDLESSPLYDTQSMTGLVSHRAGLDAVHCGLLLYKIAEYALESGIAVDSAEELLEVLYEVCYSPIQIKYMPFGKHRGELLRDVPIEYLQWAVSNTDFLNENHVNFDADLAASIISVVDERLP